MSEEPAVRPVQPSLPELSEHATFLRRLAARLVGPDGADDLVQEAYATALTRPPSRGSLRGWLAIVVANLARRERRSAERRAAREERAARPEREDDSTLALERLDLQRALSAFVVALPEEQRTVLYLRYFEDLTPSAIAARLGVPLKTIESRHTRALASPRAQLDERSGGDREAWASVLAPWALFKFGATGAAWFAWGAIALVLFGGWFAWRGLAPRSLRSEPSVASVPKNVPIEVGPTAGESQREPRQIPPQVSAAPGVLTGVVLAEKDRTPVTGVSVEVRLGSGERTEYVELATDSEGRFRFETPIARRVIGVRAAASERTVPRYEPVERRLEPGETLALELLAAPGASLSGIVVDEGGAPVAGATVLGSCSEELYRVPPPERRVTSNGEGCFLIEHLGGSFRLIAEAPGMACLEGVRGTIASGAHGERIVLRLATARVFRGEVVDGNGRPVEGVALQAGGFTASFSGDQTSIPGVKRFDAENLSGATDAQGRFELGPSPHVASRVNLRTRWKGGYIDQYASVKDDEWNRIVLDTGLELSGVVRNLAGVPIAGALVEVSDTAQGTATTDAQGIFTIGGLRKASSALVLALAPGHAMAVVEPVRVEPGARQVELRLGPELMLAGRVVDESGRPLAEARLRLEGDRLVGYDFADHGVRMTWEWAAGRNETRTDAEGKFRFAQLYDGEFEIHVWPSDGPKVAQPFRARSGQEALELVVEERSRLGVVFSGRVLDALTGQPIPRFTVNVFEPSRFAPASPVEEEGEEEDEEFEVVITESWSGHGFPVASERGEYLLSGHLPGLYYLAFSVPGYLTGQLGKRDYALGETREDILLWPARSVSFRLVDDGRTSEASLSFHNARGEVVQIDAGGGVAGSCMNLDTRSDAAAILPRQPVTALASARGHGEVRLALGADDDGPIEVRFEPEEERRVHLQIYERRDSAPSRPESSLEELRQAVLAGELIPPREAVELEARQPSGNLYCRGRLTPKGNGRFEESLSYPQCNRSTGNSGSSDGSIGLALPASIRQVTLTSRGCRGVTLDLDQPGPWAERPEFRLVVLERLE
ncbi:MAG: sigma-70 family RNA polymerase sigma factor [Planctomycetota bacterium]